MKLDVVIPTYNRQHLLVLTLRSLFSADVPAGLEILVTVVDNNSTDETKSVVQQFVKEFPKAVRYCTESRQGRSHALNAGITSTSGDLVGIIDDDEEIDREWYKTIFNAFTKGDVDFIGGPYVPRWSTAQPAWMPREYGSVVGWVDGGDREVPFDHSYPGILMGGNAVFKRSILEKVGLFATWLGRTDKGLLSGEDEDLYERLLRAGAKGMYLPSLIIYHHIPAERLTKRYFRSWCFWRGVSVGLLDRKRKASCPYLMGIPRWQYRKAAEGVLLKLRYLFLRPSDPARAFASELGIWDFGGRFYGRHFRRAPELLEETNQ
jgi:glucosyl-dolichyl phosphate glucuronosyltransferase